RHAQGRQRVSLRAAALRIAVLQAGLRAQGQSRGRVVSHSVSAPAPEHDSARRLGQIEHHDTLAARNARLVVGDALTVRVRRCEEGRTSSVEQFQVPYQRWMRVLDALTWIAENKAPDIAYRWFCGTKMCGTCAVRMNGREVLACWEAVEPDM